MHAQHSGDEKKLSRGFPAVACLVDTCYFMCRYVFTQIIDICDTVYADMLLVVGGVFR